MKKFIYLICFIIPLVSLGSCSSRKMTSESEDRNGNLTELPFDTIGFEQMVAKNIFPVIPDHYISDTTALRKYCTTELADLLIEAFETPSMCPGDLGEEEFLFYFVSGNGDSPDKSILPEVKLDYLEKDHAKVKVNWNSREHTLDLINIDNQWLLDDFDSQKQEIINYISDARSFFSSGEYKNVEYPYDSWLEELKIYFEKYLNKPFEPLTHNEYHELEGYDFDSDSALNYDIDQSFFPSNGNYEAMAHFAYGKPIFINTKNGTEISIKNEYAGLFSMTVGNKNIGPIDFNMVDSKLYIELNNYTESHCPVPIPFIVEFDGLNTTLTLMPPKISRQWGEIKISPNGQVSYKRVNDKPKPQIFKLYKLGNR